MLVCFTYIADRASRNHCSPQRQGLLGAHQGGGLTGPRGGVG